MPELRTVAVETASDAELVRLVLGKDEAATRALMQRYNRRLYRVARGVVRDDSEAEDVLQEAYLRAFAALADFRGESSLSTWLTRIVLNQAVQRLRRRTDVPVSDIDQDAERRGAEVIPFPASQSTIDPERAMAQQQLCQLVERAIDELPCEFRTVLVARVIEGMSWRRLRQPSICSRKPSKRGCIALGGCSRKPWPNTSDRASGTCFPSPGSGATGSPMPSLNGSTFKKAGTSRETLHPTFHAASRATPATAHHGRLICVIHRSLD